jgi:N-acetylmuramoyl-L-alanine amidase
VTPAGAAATASKVLSNPNRAAHELGLDDSDNSDLLHMLVDVNQQAVLARSELLAESILNALSRRDLPPTRSVKQKSFSVLRTITMPSVLVEVGFLTNRSDAKIIRSESGRDRIAASIARGIVAFLSKHPPARTEGDQLVVHKVKRGENLWKISRKYGTSVASLRKANRLGKSSVLRIGQELLISNGY